MNKAYRQAQILKVIQHKRVHTQDELARELKRAGIEATQVTLSRDIKDLGLGKTGEGYVPMGRASVNTGPDLHTVLSEFLQDVRLAQNLVVLRTAPASAGQVAAALDREDWPEIVGTIAGDDTVMVAAADASLAGKLRTKLLRFLA
jgi:transcriptional regulator of arginine metabolism